MKQSESFKKHIKFEIAYFEVIKTIVFVNLCFGLLACSNGSSDKKTGSAVSGPAPAQSQPQSGTQVFDPSKPGSTRVPRPTDLTPEEMSAKAKVKCVGKMISEGNEVDIDTTFDWQYFRDQKIDVMKNKIAGLTEKLFLQRSGTKSDNRFSLGVQRMAGSKNSLGFFRVMAPQGNDLMLSYQDSVEEVDIQASCKIELPRQAGHLPIENLNQKKLNCIGYYQSSFDGLGKLAIHKDKSLTELKDKEFVDIDLTQGLLKKERDYEIPKIRMQIKKDEYPYSLRIDGMSEGSKIEVKSQSTKFIEFDYVDNSTLGQRVNLRCRP